MRMVQRLHGGHAVRDYLAMAGAPVHTSDVAARFGIDDANASRLVGDRSNQLSTVQAV